MEAAKDLVRSKYQDLCNFLERDTRGSELVIYGTSALRPSAEQSRLPGRPQTLIKLAR